MSNSNSDLQPIYVTQPYLPPLNEFLPSLEAIWQNRILTNGGPFHQQFERELAEYLGVEHVSLFCNATVALITALQALRVVGEVITTPFSFVATAHSLLWNGAKPVFVDIDSDSFGLDPQRIEAAITPQTTAIMPVHVYGRPCDVDAIEHIARTHNLRVIYDAAHAFGVDCHCGGLLKHGDLSVLSFHATKVFNTFEGGAIICRDAEMKRRIDYLKNFGFADEVTVFLPGINGKMSEFNAALGLQQLKYVDEAISKRGVIAGRYRNELQKVRGLTIPRASTARRDNYSYFPVLVNAEYPESRDALCTRLRERGIFARRYFYPLISDFPMYQTLPSSTAANLPVATQVASQILCLPIYPDLAFEDQQRVINVLSSV